MNIGTIFDAGRLTLCLAGELDHHEARSTMRLIEDLLDEYMPRDCVLNMSELSFMDSSGIAIVINALRRMEQLGGRLRLQGLKEQPRKVLRAAGIEKIVEIREVIR